MPQAPTTEGVNLRELRDLLRAGPPPCIGYGQNRQAAFAHGWNAAYERIWNHLSAQPAFKAMLEQMDRENHEGAAS